MKPLLLAAGLLAMTAIGCPAMIHTRTTPLQVEVRPVVITVEENPHVCRSRRIVGYGRSPCTTHTIIEHRSVVRTHRHRHSVVHTPRHRHARRHNHRTTRRHHHRHH